MFQDLWNRLIFSGGGVGCKILLMPGRVYMDVFTLIVAAAEKSAERRGVCVKGQRH